MRTHLGFWLCCADESLDEVALLHMQYLTPAHLRKGKGGRQPALDPRLDPSIEPRKAKRILANRLSAARSKMKQKSEVQVRRPPNLVQLPGTRPPPCWVASCDCLLLRTHVIWQL